jgi:hypothetical protein
MVLGYVDDVPEGNSDHVPRQDDPTVIQSSMRTSYMSSGVMDIANCRIY